MSISDCINIIESQYHHNVSKSNLILHIQNDMGKNSSNINSQNYAISNDLPIKYILDSDNNMISQKQEFLSNIKQENLLEAATKPLSSHAKPPPLPASSTSPFNKNGNSSISSSSISSSSSTSLLRTPSSSSSTTSPTNTSAGLAQQNTKKCKVCSDKAVNQNFGVLSCESCKAFFRRNAIRTSPLKCSNSSEGCSITPTTRKQCPSCRLKKCREVGMRSDLIQIRKNNPKLTNSKKKSTSSASSTMTTQSSSTSSLSPKQDGTQPKWLSRTYLNNQTTSLANAITSSTNNNNLGNSSHSNIITLPAPISSATISVNSSTPFPMTTNSQHDPHQSLHNMNPQNYWIKQHQQTNPNFIGPQVNPHHQRLAQPAFIHTGLVAHNNCTNNSNSNNHNTNLVHTITNTSGQSTIAAATAAQLIEPIKYDLELSPMFKIKTDQPSLLQPIAIVPTNTTFHPTNHPGISQQHMVNQNNNPQILTTAPMKITQPLHHVYTSVHNNQNNNNNYINDNNNNITTNNNKDNNNNNHNHNHQNNNVNNKSTHNNKNNNNNNNKNKNAKLPQHPFMKNGQSCNLPSEFTTNPQHLVWTSASNANSSIMNDNKKGVFATNKKQLLNNNKNNSHTTNNNTNNNNHNNNNLLAFESNNELLLSSNFNCSNQSLYPDLFEGNTSSCFTRIDDEEMLSMNTVDTMALLHGDPSPSEVTCHLNTNSLDRTSSSNCFDDDLSVFFNDHDEDVPMNNINLYEDSNDVNNNHHVFHSNPIKQEQFTTGEENDTINTEELNTQLLLNQLSDLYLDLLSPSALASHFSANNQPLHNAFSLFDDNCGMDDSGVTQNWESDFFKLTNRVMERLALFLHRVTLLLEYPSSSMTSLHFTPIISVLKNAAVSTECRVILLPIVLSELCATKHSNYQTSSASTTLQDLFPTQISSSSSSSPTLCSPQTPFIQNYPSLSLNKLSHRIHNLDPIRYSALQYFGQYSQSLQNFLKPNSALLRSLFLFLKLLTQQQTPENNHCVVYLRQLFMLSSTPTLQQQRQKSLTQFLNWGTEQFDSQLIDYFLQDQYSTNQDYLIQDFIQPFLNNDNDSDTNNVKPNYNDDIDDLATFIL